MATLVFEEINVDSQDEPIDLAASAIDAAKQKLADIQQEAERQDMTPELERRLEDAETAVVVAEAVQREMERRLINPGKVAASDETNEDTI
jgi:hypothetical protein